MTDWHEIILSHKSPEGIWQDIFVHLLQISKESDSPVTLHKQTVAGDRLLAESAWKLWNAYNDKAARTSNALVNWWESQPAGINKAILVLDALSLRELAAILGGGHEKGIDPVNISITGSEVPSDTDQFAQALGASSRSSLSNNAKSGSFKLGSEVYTDVMSHPFEDCVGSVPAVNDVFIWHTWLDDLIHLHKRLPDQIYKTATEAFHSDGFWDFVNRMRQGRKLIITADHGYAVSKLFSTSVSGDAAEALKKTFGAKRCTGDGESWDTKLMPPMVLSQNGHHVVMGQTKWRVQGGFPQVCHGGLSLLEVAVPFIELAAK